MKINNEIYNQSGDAWWDDNGDSNLVSLRFISNDVRFRYIHALIRDKLERHPENRSVLDVGCGGGYLSEELAKTGFYVTGIDPSNKSIEAASAHARQQGLAIRYLEGYGEELPFRSNTFDFICCCDVLEHVPDFRRVIQEIARVLKNDGLFFFDTINRTRMSKLLIIKVIQEWKRTSFLDPGVHIWEMFIKPKEIAKAMGEFHLLSKEIKGISPGLNFLSHYINLRRRSRREISWQELGKRLNLKISHNKLSNYIGYAIKSVHDS